MNPPPPRPPRHALQWKGPQRRPQQRLGRRLEEVAKAVGGGYCRLQMPLTLTLGVREAVAGHRLGALEGGGGGYLPPLQKKCIPAPPPLREGLKKGRPCGLVNGLISVRLNCYSDFGIGLIKKQHLGAEGQVSHSRLPKLLGPRAGGRTMQTMSFHKHKPVRTPGSTNWRSYPAFMADPPPPSRKHRANRVRQGSCAQMRLCLCTTTWQSPLRAEGNVHTSRSPSGDRP